RIVAGDAAAQGPALVQLVLGADRIEPAVLPVVVLGRVGLCRVVELDADLLERVPAGQVGLGHQCQPVVDFPGGAEGVDAGQGQHGARGPGDVGAAGGDE